MPPRRKNPFGGGKMSSAKNTLYVVGHARFPSETTAKHVYNNFSLGLLLDRETGEILEVSSTILPPYGNEFLRDILMGKRIPEDLKTISEEIRLRYVCRNKNTILAALGDILKRLREHEKHQNGDEE